MLSDAAPPHEPDAISRVDLGRASHEAADAIRGAVHLAAEAARAAAMAADCERVK